MSTEPNMWFVMTGRFAGRARPTPELVEAHVEYLRELRRRRHVLAAGPMERDGRRMRIYCASTLQDAQELVAADPYVRAGLLDFELDGWRLHASFSDPLMEALTGEGTSIERDNGGYPQTVTNA